MPKISTLKPRITEAQTHIQTLGSWRDGRASSTARGYDYRWQQRRLIHLAAHPLCVYCERKGIITVATIVDHIEAHRGDQKLFWDESNWQSMCKPCHDSEKQREESGND